MTAAVVLPILGTVAVGFLTFLAAWRTARVARLSNERMAAVEGWQEWRKDAQALRTEREEMLQRHRQEMTQLGEQVRVECGIRVTQMSQELALIEARLEGCIAWIRAVIPALRSAGISYPPIPRGITDTDPGLRRIHD